MGTLREIERDTRYIIVCLLYVSDTSFMYIIACLCMLKIYETRHPDVQAKAYQSYFYMAVVIIVAVLGVVSKKI